MKVELLQALNAVYRPKAIAQRLSISKQRWNNYAKGHNDMPESMIDLICAEFKLDKSALIQV